MARPIALAAGLAIILGAGAVPPPAAAQSDPAAEALIERLRPGGQTRGIRLPGAQAPAQPTAPAATAPTLTPAAPSTPLVGTQRPATQAVAPPPPATTTARPAPPPRETTAPPELPAVSLMVNFASGSARLTPQAEQTLDTLARALSSPELTPFRFRIEGHTDTVGPRAMNQALSEERAAAVRDYLIRRHGIAPQRLVAVGYGEDQLLVQTPDETPEARNRRVQVVNIGN
jgi:outer membrane protein OmpA-like peptidoglycan-associated protein